MTFSGRLMPAGWVTAIPLIGAVAPLLRMPGRRLQTPTLCITVYSIQGPRAIILSDARLAYLMQKNVTYQAFEDGSGSNDLLALLSTAVLASAKKPLTSRSELTTTPRRAGDMIVGEPGTTILFDSSNGELVDVPPSEAEDYSVTVSRDTDSNAGCWAGGIALGDMQFAGTGTATGSWPYRNSYTTGNKSGQITFAINGVTTPVAAGPWMRIATADGSGVDGRIRYPLVRMSF